MADSKSLKQLHLELTGIGDAGVAHLAGLENLEYLNLYGTKVTDAGLKTVAGLKNLKKVYIWQTPITDAAAAEAMKARPGLQVIGAANLKVVTPAAEKKEDKKPAAKIEPPKKTLAKGQFVRVRLPGKARILSLAEVQILKTGDGAELQKAGTPSQSSTGFGGASDRAIDGKTDGKYDAGSVTHTESQDDPWWLVDLEIATGHWPDRDFQSERNWRTAGRSRNRNPRPSSKSDLHRHPHRRQDGSVHPFEAK